ELRVRSTAEFVEQAGHIRQPLCELWANRPADDHLQATDAVEPVPPQRFGQQPKVGGAVVGVFERQLLRFGASQLGLVECRQDSGIPDAETALAQGDAYE